MLSYCHDLICYTYVLAMYYPYTIDMLVTHYLAPHTPRQGQNVQTISYIEPPTYSLQDHDHDVGFFFGLIIPQGPRWSVSRFASWIIETSKLGDMKTLLQDDYIDNRLPIHYIYIYILRIDCKDR